MIVPEGWPSVLIPLSAGAVITILGWPLLVIVFAGLVARRIAFDHFPGDDVKRGDRIGLIRYGSLVNVFLPDDATILVQEGDQVRAGKSALARLGGTEPS